MSASERLPRPPVDRRPRHRLEKRPRPRDPVLQLGEAPLLVGEGARSRPRRSCTAANFAVSLARCTCPASVSMSGASRASSSSAAAIPAASAWAGPSPAPPRACPSPRRKHRHGDVVERDRHRLFLSGAARRAGGDTPPPAAGKGGAVSVSAQPRARLRRALRLTPRRSGQPPPLSPIWSGLRPPGEPHGPHPDHLRPALHQRRQAPRATSSAASSRPTSTPATCAPAATRCCFICATDEHGTPAELAAAEAGEPVADYCARLWQVQKRPRRRLPPLLRPLRPLLPPAEPPR